MTIGRIGPKISSVISGSSSGGVDDDGRIDLDRRRIGAAADRDGALGGRQRGGEPVEVALVDDALAAELPASKVATASPILATSSSRTVASAST